ncbi:MAG: Rieske 2Fe-2S domain-containing protein [Candidatus Symbiobacter sp.]|nr:Rieske 2Fe-2S domain-containing protein [Candidatus Symbiobacter sp.]
MTFQKVCGLDDLWEGEMNAVEVNGHRIILVCLTGGEVRAFQATCPHQEFPLKDGTFDGQKIVCKAHLWTFDGNNGAGINPRHCKLAQYPVRIENDAIFLATEGVVPEFFT